MSAAAFLVGRKHTRLLPTTSTTDALFAGQLLDGEKFSGVEFQNCTFANVSFKGCDLSGVKFDNCTFASCYFRNARLTSVEFRASRFIDCDLSKIDVRTCDLKWYNTFQGCFIPFRELEQSLPGEGNLKAHLCSTLSDEARRAGALKDAGLYRQAGAEAREAHLLAAVRQASQFYKDKYKGWNRFGAFVDYAASRSRGWLWGYRNSFLVVLRNWALLTLLAFPLAFIPLRADITEAGAKPSLPDLWLVSLGNTLPGSGIVRAEFLSWPARLIAFSEVLVGLLLAGLAVSLLFRAVFDRWR